MSEALRIIKKYPNRRLYDTAISSYITLADVKNLVLECVPLKVIDAKTEEDLTNTTLLQIISDQEGSNSPIFTTNVLENLIRFYGHSMQSMMSNYLEQSMKVFLTQQDMLQESMKNVVSSNPLSAMNELTQRNMEMWQSFQKQFYPSEQTGKADTVANKDDQNKE